MPPFINHFEILDENDDNNHEHIVQDRIIHQYSKYSKYSQYSTQSIVYIYIVHLYFRYSLCKRLQFIWGLMDQEIIFHFTALAIKIF